MKRWGIIKRDRDPSLPFEWYEWLYFESDLKMLQNFDKEYFFIFRNRTNMIQFARVMCLCFLAFDVLFTLYVWGLEMLFYFTNWTLLTTVASIVCSAQVARNTDAPKNISLMAIHHFLYTCSIIFNCVSVSVYWILIHEEVTWAYKDY